MYNDTCLMHLVTAGWSSSVARRAHNPKVVGSNPAPATRKKSEGYDENRNPLFVFFTARCQHSVSNASALSNLLFWESRRSILKETFKWHRTGSDPRSTQEFTSGSPLTLGGGITVSLIRLMSICIVMLTGNNVLLLRVGHRMAIRSKKHPEEGLKPLLRLKKKKPVEKP